MPDCLNKHIITSSEGFYNHHTLYLEILKGSFNRTHKFVDPVEQLITICELLTRLCIILLHEHSALLCCCRIWPGLVTSPIYLCLAGTEQRYFQLIRETVEICHC